jgi:hypothetical protein
MLRKARNEGLSYPANSVILICVIFKVLSDEEIGDVFGFEACVSAEFFQGNELAFFLPEFFADPGEELTGRAVSTTSDVHNIFGINDYPVGYRVHSIWIQCS